jgi:hypothetical protein
MSVLIVSVDGVPYAAFTDYEKAQELIRKRRAIDPDAFFSIEEVPMDYTTPKLVYTVHFNSNGDLTATGSYYRLFGDEAQAMKQGTEVWETVVGGVVATSLIGFDDAITRGKEFMEKQRIEISQ